MALPFRPQEVRPSFGTAYPNYVSIGLVACHSNQAVGGNGQTVAPIGSLHLAPLLRGHGLEEHCLSTSTSSQHQRSQNRCASSIAQTRQRREHIDFGRSHFRGGEISDLHRRREYRLRRQDVFQPSLNILGANLVVLGPTGSPIHPDRRCLASIEQNLLDRV